MRHRRTRVSTLPLVAGAIAVHSSAAADIVAVDLGLGGPPGTLGGYAMTPFPADGRALYEMVTTAPGPFGLDLTTDHPVSHQRIEPGFWSHAYFGDAYWSAEESVVIALPPGTSAFYLYAVHTFGGIHPVTVEADDGTGLSFPGESFGARGFGFYGTQGSMIRTIRVTTVSPLFGEFGIHVPPCAPIDYTGDGLIDFTDFLAFLNRFTSQEAPADLNGDGLIDFVDFLVFLDLYSMCEG